MNNLQTTYSTLVDSFQTIVKENSAVTTEPKYHIRGFFPIPEYRYSDGSTGGRVEEIIGFDIAYRYIKEDGTATQLNTFSYTASDGTEYTGTFTDWVIEQGPMKTKIRNTETGLSEWRAENIADGTETNINQIDIAISKGEKVEIKVRSISEAGYPDNPLRSDWSNSIVMDFPSTLATGNEIADLIQKVNDDALTLTIQNTLDSIGVGTHLDDTTPNSNSVNGIYFKHMAKYIAYEEKGVSEAGTTIVNTISLQDKIDEIGGSVDTVLKTAEEMVIKVEDISVRAVDKHKEYDNYISIINSSISELKDNVNQVNADLNSFVKLNRDANGNVHPEILAKSFIIPNNNGLKNTTMFVDDDNKINLVTDYGTSESRVATIIVDDVEIGTGPEKINARRAFEDIDASISQKASNSSVVVLDSSVKNAYNAISDVSNRVKLDTTNITKINETIQQFWNEELKRIQVGAIGFKTNQGIETYVMTGTNSGDIEIHSGADGNGGLGTLIVNDVKLGSDSLSDKVDVINNLDTEVGNIKSNISSINTSINALMGSGTAGDESVTKLNITGGTATFETIEATQKVSLKSLEYTGDDNTFSPYKKEGTNTKLLEGKFSNINVNPTGTEGSSYDLVQCIQKYDTFIDNYQDWLSSAADAGGHIQFGTNSEITIDHIICQNIDVPGTLRIGKPDSTGSLGEQYAQFDFTGSKVKLYSTSMTAGETILEVDDLLFKKNANDVEGVSLRNFLYGNELNDLAVRIVDEMCKPGREAIIDKLAGALLRLNGN